MRKQEKMNTGYYFMNFDYKENTRDCVVTRERSLFPPIVVVAFTFQNLRERVAGEENNEDKGTRRLWRDIKQKIWVNNTRSRVKFMDRIGEGGAYMINKHMYRYVTGPYGKDEEI